jgi:hypothetical protein
VTKIIFVFGSIVTKIIFVLILSIFY